MTELKVVPMSVEYVDHLGSDLNVVNAARVSFAKEVTEFDLDKDTKLINYLAKHNHWSPLAHTAVTIRVKAPIFMARQFVKHQIGLVWNEESRRYISDEPEFYVPEVFRLKPTNAKQGSSSDFPEYVNLGFMQDLRDSTKQALNLYNYLLQEDVAPEQARMVLPQNVMTNWMWTGSLVAFARVCQLRLDSHAQKEAQELAQLINDVVAPLYPVSWSALMNKTVG
jgi:thymidylate synthase (FAD)